MSTNSKLLLPDSSPNVVTKSIGVRRVNNLPIVIFGAIMLIFMLLMMIVAMNRAAERGQYDFDGNHDTHSSNSFASLIAKDYIGGIIEPKTQNKTPDLTEKHPCRELLLNGQRIWIDRLCRPLWILPIHRFTPTSRIFGC